jgi:hypothetical protein
MIENVTYTCGYTIPLTYQDGIVFGIAIGITIVLVMALTIVYSQNKVVKESIYRPESFKVRQSEFKERHERIN